jgi:hypothetical protein
MTTSQMRAKLLVTSEGTVDTNPSTYVLYITRDALLTKSKSAYATIYAAVVVMRSTGRW